MLLRSGFIRIGIATAYQKNHTINHNYGVRHMGKKYICVEEYIDRQRAYPKDTKTTLKYVFASLREADQADVIPTDFIREWFRQHYGTYSCSLIDDWNKERGAYNSQETDDEC